MSQFNTSNMAASIAVTQNSPHIRLDIAWLRDQGAKLKPRAFKVLTVLLARAGRNGSIFPSHQSIARDSGLSLATVKRALLDLRDAGLLIWKGRVRKDGGRTSNDYEISGVAKVELSPQVKLSEEIIQEATPPISEAHSPSEPLGAAEVAQLKSLGVSAAFLFRNARKRIAGCRHALAVVTARPRILAKARNKGAVVADIILHPYLYEIEPKAAPRIPGSLKALLVHFDKYDREQIQKWFVDGDKGMTKILNLWEGMGEEKRKLFAETRMSTMSPWHVYLEEVAAG